jgi:hypothetical protein
VASINTSHIPKKNRIGKHLERGLKKFKGL